jgi:type IV pilus assembly protein PilE
MKPGNVQGGPVAVSARRVRGFTLIEMMITVVIIGILAAVAYPSYLEYVRKGNRSAAQTFMMTIANRQEQYLLTNRSYTATISDLGGLVPPPETTGKYTFAVVVPATTLPVPSYEINATAIGTQAVDGDLTLLSNGTKSPAEKWQR